MPRLVLIDGSSYLYRAFHALPPLSNAHGEPTGALFGVVNMLRAILKARPDYAAFVADAPGPTFRDALYPQYKANRPPAPPDLMRQFEGCKAIARALGVAVLADATYEADDLIGSALARLREAGFRGVVVSADKDFGQLIGADDEQWDPPRNQRWDSAGVKSRLGVHPHQVADYLALTGDAVDNIPGVPGIGAKTAAILLHHFGNLETLLARADEVAFLRTRGAAAAAMRLREHAGLARLSRALTAIALDAPVPAQVDAYRRRDHGDGLDELLERLRFGPLTRARVRALREQATAGA